MEKSELFLDLCIFGLKLEGLLRKGRLSAFRDVEIAFQLCGSGLQLPVMVLCGFLLGAAGQVVKLCADTAMQIDVDDALRGHVFTVQDALFWMSFAAGEDKEATVEGVEIEHDDPEVKTVAEKAVRQALSEGKLRGNEKFPARATVTLSGLGLSHEIKGEIELE